MRPAIGRRLAVRLAGTLGLTGAGVALLQRSPARRAAAAAGAEIVGTWQIISPGPAMRLLQTYNADGSHLSIHDEHPTRSPQLGSWVGIGDRQFLMRNLSFRFDITGRHTGSIDVRALYTVSPSGDTMTGSGIRIELDTEGTALGPPIQWESEGVRIQPVSLD